MSMWNPFKRQSKTAGKATKMAETTPAAFDYEKLGAAVAKAMAPAFTDALAPLAEQVGRLQPASTPATTPADAGQKTLTLEDIDKLVSTKLQAVQQQSQSQQARQAYIASKLADLPEEYQGALGTDPAQFAAQEQAIRGRYKGLLDKLGVKPAEVSGGASAAAGAVAPSAQVARPDDKRSPVQKIAAGLAADKTVTGPQSAVAAAAK
jgi:hypothetical protein